MCDLNPFLHFPFVLPISFYLSQVFNRVFELQFLVFLIVSWFIRLVDSSNKVNELSGNNPCFPLIYRLSEFLLVELLEFPDLLVR